MDLEPIDLSRIAGVDEVGRGCLFGPVVTAAVILDDHASRALIQLGLKDSKKLSPSQRQHLALEIQQRAIDYQIGLASVAEIDRLNILRASLLAMARAVHQLSPAPDHCWVDGNQRIPDLIIPQTTLIGGDNRAANIAAASVLAKVSRDRLLTSLDRAYPGYDLSRNKGYGTARHRQALTDLGLTRHHRRSFAPCQAIEQLHLFATAQPPPRRDESHSS
jgi:ribonuclease HII